MYGGVRVVGYPGNGCTGDGAYPSASPWHGSGHPPDGSEYPNLGKTKGNPEKSRILGKYRKYQEFSENTENVKNSQYFSEVVKNSQYSQK